MGRASGRCARHQNQLEERSMADKETGVYRITEIVGTSKTSWEDAAKNAAIIGFL
jgi:hypothetical protein